MKKRWLFVTLLAGALAIGITGGTVLAQESGITGESPFKSFAARLATILGVDEASVQDAMKQASKEIQDEVMQKKLDNMVAKGLITQEQADQMAEWYQSRPDVLSPSGPLKGFGGHGFHRRHKFGGGGWNWKDSNYGVVPTPTSSGSTSF